MFAAKPTLPANAREKVEPTVLIGELSPDVAADEYLRRAKVAQRCRLMGAAGLIQAQHRGGFSCLAEPDWRQSGNYLTVTN